MNNSRKTTIYAIVLVAILALVSCIACFISLTPNSQFENEAVNLQNMVDHTTVTTVNTDNGNGLEDGRVYSPLNGSGTKLTSGGGVFLSGTTNYYLDSDITLTGDWKSDTGKAWSGTLDGRGYKIILQRVHNNNANMGDAHWFSGLVDGQINGGTIKNVTIEIQSTFTRCWGGGNSVYKNIEVAAIAGRVGTGGATLDNVKIVCNTAGYIRIKNDSKITGCYSALFGYAQGNISLKNVTFDMQQDLQIAFQRKGSTKIVYAGLVAGSIDDGKIINMTNVTIQGSGNFKQTDDAHSNYYIRMGTFLGNGKATLNIDGLDAGGWTGSTTKEGTEGSSTVAKISPLGTINKSCVLAKTGLHLDSEANYLYTVDHSEIGFCRGNNASKIWIGELSNFRGSEKTIEGKYVSSFVSGAATYDCAATVAPAGILKPTIPTIEKSAIGAVTSIDYGYYAFAANEAESIETSLVDEYTKVNDNKFTKQYNSYKTESLKINHKIYASSTVKGTIQSNWASEIASSTIKNVGSYNFNKTIGTTAFTTNKQYFVLYSSATNYYNITLEITKAEATSITLGEPNVQNETEGGNSISQNGNLYEKDYDGVKIVLEKPISLIIGGNEDIENATITLTANQTFDGQEATTNGFKVVNVRIDSNGQDIEYTFTCTIRSNHNNFDEFTRAYRIKINPAIIDISDTTQYPYSTFVYNGEAQNVALSHLALPINTKIKYYKAEDYTLGVNASNQIEVYSSETPSSGAIPKDVGNYRIQVVEQLLSANTEISVGNWFYAITPKEVELTTAVKEYDGDSSLNAGSDTIIFSGICDSENNSHLGFSGNIDIADFNDKNVNNSKTITFKSNLYGAYTTKIPNQNLTINNRIVNKNYYLASTSYNIGTIYPKTLTFTNTNKEYDGDNTINATDSITFSGYVNGEAYSNLGLSGQVGNYDDKYTWQSNSAKPVKFTATNSFTYNNGTQNVTLDRIASSNYCISNTNRNNDGWYSVGYIYPKVVTISSVSKMFDEDTTINASTDTITFDGIVSGDPSYMVLSGVVGNFDNKNVGTNKTITYTSVEPFVYPSGNGTVTIGTRILGKTTLDDGSTQITRTNYCLPYNPTQTSFNVGAITKAPLTLKFDDTKQLYDSIIDYQNNNYDFIYVRSTSYTQEFLKPEVFTRMYNKHFTQLVKANGTAVSNINSSNQATLVKVTIDSISTSVASNNYLKYEWVTTNTEYTNNYDITASQVLINTTGSGRNGSVFTYCEPAQNGKKARVIVVEPAAQVASADDVSNLSEYQPNGINPPLYQFMTSHYYDNTTYSAKTIYTLDSNSVYWMDRNFTGSRIMASYKTINGNGATIRYRNHGLDGSNDIYEITGKSDFGLDTKNAETGKTYSNFDAEYLGHFEYENTKYYAAGMLMAINYGTIMNCNFSYWVNIQGDKKQGYQITFQGYNNKNTSIGSIIGANAGIFKENSVTVDRKITYNARGSSSYSFAAGNICGINTGIISFENKTFTQPLTVTEENRTYTIANVLQGSASNYYYGLVTGINGSYATLTNITFEYKISTTINNSGGNLYAGGIAGYNDRGKIQSCTYSGDGASVFEAIPGNNYNGYLGGITSYNIGNGDFSIQGIIDNCMVENRGSIRLGNDSTLLKGYVQGGIAGITSGGKIDACKIINRNEFYARTSGVHGSNTGYYLGLLVGVGCEEGTVSDASPMMYGTTIINKGQLTNCQSFNFAGDSGVGANYGGWGYVAGKYNTILSGNPTNKLNDLNQPYQYVHEYGNIIWYSASVPAGYNKCVFGEIASILGANSGLGSGSDNIYITGLAGIGIIDLGDQTLARSVLNNISISGDTITISYNNPANYYSGYTGMQAYMYKVDGTKQEIKSYTTTLSSGSFAISAQDANAIIYSTNTPASSADVVMFMHTNIDSKAAWYSFLGNSLNATFADVGAGSYDVYKYCAGQGNFTVDFTLDAVYYDGTNKHGSNALGLKQDKVVNGQNHTITYTWGSSKSDVITNRVVIANDYGETKNVNSTGQFVSTNNGTIMNINIVIDPTKNDTRDSHFSIHARGQNEISTLGALCGVNNGIIENCTATIYTGYGVEMSDTDAGYRTGAVGGLVGLNNNGTIRNCDILITKRPNYQRGAVYAYVNSPSSSSTNTIVLGGAVGIAFGGVYEGITVRGPGTMGCDQDFLEGVYIGGVFGCMPLTDNVILSGYRMKEVDSINGINAFLKGVDGYSIEAKGLRKASAAYVSGLTVGNLVEAQASTVWGKVLNSNINVISFGEVDAFQKTGRYENSLYGYAADYTKDYTKTRERDEYEIAKATNRIVLQDGSSNGYGVRAQSTIDFAYVNSNRAQLSSVTVNMSWNSSTTAQSVERKQDLEVNVKSTTGVSVSNSTISFTNLNSARNSSTSGYKIFINFKYSIAIAAETLVHTANTADSPYVNFVSGVGNKYIYAGATTGTLSGNISYNKQISAVLELNERKTLDGNNHYIYAQWNTQRNKSPIIDKVMGQSAATNNASDVGEYNIWYQATSSNNPIKYYGVSDCISINRGTIKNLNFEFNISKVSGYDGKHHDYSSLYGNNVNTSYGSLCGVNLGTIENCVTKTNTPASFTGEEATGELLVSPGVGLNNGIIKNTHVELTSSYEYKGVAKSVIMGGIAAVNAFDGSIINSRVTINGDLIRSCTAKTDASSGVVFGGIVGINDGGAIDCVTIDGSSKIIASNMTPAGDADFVSDANYLYFAIGVAISNNVAGVSITYLGHPIQPCVESIGPNQYRNKVKNILIRYEGEVEYSVNENYMLGLAFAKATDYTKASLQTPAYEGIIVENNYGGFIELYTAAGYLTQSSYSGSTIGLGLSLMGHINQVGGATDFVHGGRIDSNANNIDVAWEYAAGGVSTIIVTTQDPNIIGLKELNLETMPEKTLMNNYYSDTSQYEYTTSGNTKQIKLKRSLLNEMYNNIARLTQIDIVFDYPFVEIEDVFQLRQFVEFDSKDSVATVLSDYVARYASSINELISRNLKKATATDYLKKAWTDEAGKTALINAGKYTESEMYAYNGNYLLIEKFSYNGQLVSYYAANIGRLTKDIVLDKYTSATETFTVNVGWNTAVLFEMDESKILEGNNKTITLVADNFKFNEIGDARVLNDINQTPGYYNSSEKKAYCMSAFVGCLRGEIKDTNFLFREGSQLNITDYIDGKHEALDMKAPAYVGLITGYSTGRIDNCNLEMGDNTQLYIYKYSSADNAYMGAYNWNKQQRNVITLGGAVGLLGKGAILSNITVDMGENSILAINSKGNRVLQDFAGGIVGMMLANSQLYNAKIEGAASSLIMSVVCTDVNENYDSARTLAAGAVGCNTTAEKFNYHGLGKGEIDGLIFNWKGASLTIYDDNRDKKNLYVFYYGGAAYGMVDEDSMKNTYYTFDIASFDKINTQDFTLGNASGTGIYIHNKEGSYSQATAYYPSTTYYTKTGDNTYVAVPNLTASQFSSGTYYTTRNYFININYGSNNNLMEQYGDVNHQVNFKDIFDNNGINTPYSTIRIYELSPNATGTGLSFNKTNSYESSMVEADGSTSPVIINEGVSNFNATNYEMKLNLGDLLKWADNNKASPIICEFTAGEADSSVMWAINIKGAVINTNQLQASATSLTEIPVYKFATSLTEAAEFKHVKYTLQRNQGDGIEIYYCTGNAATISPDKNYYTNKADANETVYHPLRAIMYDGKTDAQGLTVDIYDQNGQTIPRLSSASANIITTAKQQNGIRTEIYEKNAQGTYVRYTGTDKLTKIGSYMVVFNICSNGINQNAYISETYRTQFFNAKGNTATAVTNATTNAVEYYLVEQYVIYLVIAPISVSFTQISKIYDGTTDINYAYTNGTNYSQVKATLRQPFTYSVTANPSITEISGGIALSGSSNVNLVLQGSYDLPNVGDRTVTVEMGGSITYTIYEIQQGQNGASDKVITKNITQQYLANKGGDTKSYFTIDETCVDLTNDPSATTRNYGFDGDLTNGYQIQNSNSCTVKIANANAPTITTNFTSLEFNYTGSDIDYSATLKDKITIVDQFGRELDVQALLTNNELTITSETIIRDVNTSGYNITITVAYVGSNYANTSVAPTQMVYILPAQLTISKVIKEYDGNNNTENATFVATGTLIPAETSKISDLSGTYSDPNVGKDIPVTIDTTSATINGHSYKLVTINSKTNYYIANSSIPVGVITPLYATIANAYKTYDGTNALDTTTGALVLDASNTALPYAITATYAQTTVGKTGLNVTLLPFEYVDAQGATQRRYLLTNGGAQTNYAVQGATSASYLAQDIAYILPRAITISYIYKDYDGDTTFDNATFDMTGFISGDVVNKFDGYFATKNVHYTNGNYNDAYVNSEDFVYSYNDGSQVLTATAQRLVSSSNPTNYTLDDSPSHITYASNRYKLTGKGVIIPQLIEVLAVKKYYDGKNTFNTYDYRSETEIYGEIRVGSSTWKNYYLSGTMSGTNATNGQNLYNVTLTSVKTFTFNGASYVWVYHSNNSEHNYRVANATINGIGDVIKKEIKISTTGSGSEGTLYDLKFNVSSVVDSSGSVAIGDRDITYTYGQYYSINNFEAKLRWNNADITLSNGRLTVDGITMTFSLNGKSVTNAGDHTFTLKMTSTNSNFEVKNNNASFTIKINKRAINANQVSIIVANPTKEYDGTADTTSVTMPTAGTLTATAPGVSGSETITRSASVSGLTIPADCINAGEYTGLTLSASITDTNYTFSGTVTNLYSEGTTPTKYVITPKTITLNSTIDKEFDGTNSSIKVPGIEGETVVAKYAIGALGVLPGLYTGTSEFEVVNVIVSEEAVNQQSNATNYTVEAAGGFELNILPAKIIVEREFNSTNSGINYFDIVLSIPNLKGLDFLAQGDGAATGAQVAAFIENQTQNVAEIKAAIANLFAVKFNDNPLWGALSVNEIGNIRLKTHTKTITEGQTEKTYALEIVIVNDKLDTETATDRFALVMKDKEFNMESLIGSNVAESSSELAEGQFSGTYASTGEAISTLEALVAFMNSSTATAGYLTTNIHGFDASEITAEAFTKTLDGNGYTISLTGGVHSKQATDTYEAFFLAENGGTLRNINFVFTSSVELKTKDAFVGLVVANNTGTIENCSLKILNEPARKEVQEEGATQKAPISVTVAGFSAVNSGNINNSSVIYYTTIELPIFAGVAYTNTGTINYVAVRQLKGATITVAGNTIANTTTTIAYAIDALTFAHTNINTGTITKVYGSAETALSMFSDSYKEGYLDYYFTKNAKMTTNGALHNVYNASSSDNVNTTYYYNYNSASTDYRVAIEVLAPINRFIWEAFDANYQTYETNLNRAVGLFDLSANLQDNAATAVCEQVPAITFITSYRNAASEIVWVTIFNPAIGIIAETVISQGTDVVQEYEYKDGATIEATFAITTAGETTNLIISGQDVGVYTEYYEESQGASGATGQFGGFDTNNRIAKILSSEGGSGAAKIMLIITPKAADFTSLSTHTKQYDTTSIAEAYISIDGNSTKDVYAIGTYKSGNSEAVAVNTSAANGYDVYYSSYTKPAAVYNNTFLTCHLSGVDEATQKKIYTVSYAYIGNSSFTTSTNVQNANLADVARAYSQFVTREELVAINNSSNSMLFFTDQNMTLSAISNKYVYDIIFGHTVDATTNKVTYTSGMYYAGTLFNIPINAQADKTVYKNYKWNFPSTETVPTTFTSSSILAGDAETVAMQYKVSGNGRITQRTVNATYSNLDQSYRLAELESIKVEIASVTEENLGALPYSITAAQKTALKDAINNEIGNANFNADALASAATGENAKLEVVREETVNGVVKRYYRAVNQSFAMVELAALSGTYPVTTNLAVNITGGATLTLRYFHKDATTGKYKIETIEDLLKIGDEEDKLDPAIGNDYDNLDYIVTNNINGKSKVIYPIARVFNGTINGNNKTIKNLVLVGQNVVALFTNISATAKVENLTFTNILMLPLGNTPTVSVVASQNYGQINNISVHGEVATNDSQAVTIASIDGDTYGSTSGNKSFIQTRNSTTTTVKALDSTKDSNSKYVIIYRAYAQKTVENNIVKIITQTSNTATVADISADILTLASTALKANTLPLEINGENKAVIQNFRQYWVYINVCPWLAATNIDTFTGYQFEK